MQQLKMLRYGGKVTTYPLPPGYRYEMFLGTEVEMDEWVDICKHGLLPEDAGREWFTRVIADYPDLVPGEDLFFVVDSDGRRVATSASVCHGGGEGYIHMVVALPSCRGMGIGHAMLSRALEILESRGCTRIVLTTDDHRLAAVKTYLDAGFRPVIYHDPESDMRARWDTMIAALGYEPVAYVTEV